MGAIFLSYSREDRASADALIRVLEEAGHSVWWDRHLDSGEEFAAEIEAELNKAEVVLVAWSKESVKSRWVRDEAAEGGDTGRLVPVSIDGSLPPMGFRQIHTLDLKGWKGGKRDERTDALLHAVDRRLSRQAEDSVAPSAQARRFRSGTGKALWGGVAALILAGLVAVGLYLLAGGGGPRGTPAKPTIALVPFSTASPDPELRQLAAQTRESLAHTFSQSGLPLRLAGANPEDRPKVDYLMAGEFSRSGGKVVASIRLDQTAHGATVYSHRFEASPEDMRDLPERIGAQMAGNLTWAAPLMMLEEGRRLDPAVLADLLQGEDFTVDLDSLQTYQNVKRVAAKAPDLQSGQVGVAFSTAFVLSQLPGDERRGAVTEARHAADRALALKPDFGDTYATWCLLHSETLWAACEDRLRAGRRADPDAPFLNTFLSHVMRNVGRFEESTELARLAHSRDPYVPTKIGWLLKSSEFAGDGEAARQSYEQGLRWWPEFQVMFFRNRMFGLLERGDFDGLFRLEKEVGAESLSDGYQGSGALVAALKNHSIVAAKKACPETDAYLQNFRCMLALARLGDQDAAYGIAGKLYPRRVGQTPAETERIWLDQPDSMPLSFIASPAAAPMRRDPRYLSLAERTGLLAYWRSGRLPDFCRKAPEPICAQLKGR